MAYLYRHISLSTNTPFYIGIGSDEDGLYKRAYNRDSRTKLWKSIAKNGYEIEIMMDRLSWEEACRKEIEFISLYGRLDIGTGILANMTGGGDGALGHKRKTTLGKIIVTKRNRERRIPLDLLSEYEKQGWKRGRSKRCKENNSISKKGHKPWNKGKTGVYSKEVLESMSSMKGKKHSKKTINKMKSAQIGDKHPRARAVLQYDLKGNFIEEYCTITEAIRKNPTSTKVFKVCNNMQRQSGGFIWKYKK